MWILVAAQELLPDVLEDTDVAARLRPVRSRPGHRLLAYFIRIDYLMQGMIADTGSEWKLFEHHKTGRAGDSVRACAVL